MSLVPHSISTRYIPASETPLVCQKNSSSFLGVKKPVIGITVNCINILTEWQFSITGNEIM